MFTNHLFEAERIWILNHPELYLGPLHQQAVIGNIQKRYELNELRKQIIKLEAINAQLKV